MRIICRVKNTFNNNASDDIPNGHNEDVNYLYVLKNHRIRRFNRKFWNVHLIVGFHLSSVEIPT